MIAMSGLTAFRRITRNVFANPEDILNKNKYKPIMNDEVVERVRRNHLNDLENIPVFLLVALFYIGISPDPQVALWHFRFFVGSRLLHTLAYQIPLPQPSRALSFMVGMAATVSMAVQVIKALA